MYEDDDMLDLFEDEDNGTDDILPLIITTDLFDMF